MPYLDHFALLARFYDRIFTPSDTTRLREFLALPARRLLDVGGGTWPRIGRPCRTGGLGCRY